MRLTGDAWLTDGDNEIRGDTLIYDIGRAARRGQPRRERPGRRADHDQSRRPSDKAAAARAAAPTGARAPKPETPHEPCCAPSRSARATARARSCATCRSRSLRRGRRAARAQRRRQDHRLLHDRRAGALRRRPHPPRRPRTDAACRCTGARGWASGYLPQEASVFRKLSVEDNILRDPRDRATTSTTTRRARRRSSRCSRSCTSATSAAAAA